MIETTEQTLEPTSGTETELLGPVPPLSEKNRKDFSHFTKKRSRKKKLLLALLLLAIVGAGAWYFLGKKPAVIPTMSTPLAKTELRNAVSLTGTVESADSVMVYSATSMAGVVTELNVKVGDRVTAGDVLAQMDTSDLELEIAQQKAQLNQSAKQNALSQKMSEKELSNAQGDLANGLDSGVITAENALRSAQQELNNARRDLDDHKDNLEHADDVMNAAEKALNRASAARDAAQKNYDAEKREHGESGVTSETRDQLEKAEKAWDAAYRDWQSKDTEYGSNLSSYSKNYRTARISYENALANYNATKNSTEQSLENLQDKLKAAEISGDLTSSQLALQKLQKNLEESTVKAPISGTVTAAYAKVGAPGNGLLFVVEDTDQLIIKTKLKEYDVTSVKEGMPVEVKSDATGEAVFPASILRISPTAIKSADGTTQTGGSVEFETEVALNDKNSGLRVGMNVRLNVVTAKKADVWAVPFDAVMTDAQGQKQVYVARPEGEAAAMIAVLVPVTTGMETDFYIEVTSDQLKEGDQIISDPSTVIPGGPVTLMPGVGGAVAAGASSAASAG